MLRSALVLLTIAITGCSNPLSFGPGRVVIALDEAAVLAVDHEVLFPGSRKGPAATDQRQVVRMVISSQTELLSYFKYQDRQLQVRCAVDGNTDGNSYKGFALDPLPEARSASIQTSGAQTNPYRYIIYAFIDLKADNVQYEGGKPASTLDLKTEAFSSLTCHLLGVTKAPVLFPRSNDVTVSATAFQTLLSRGNAR